MSMMSKMSRESTSPTLPLYAPIAFSISMNMIFHMDIMDIMDIEDARLPLLLTYGMSKECCFLEFPWT